MSRRISMVEITFEDGRGSTIVIFSGTFTEAKKWAIDQCGNRNVKFKSTSWKPIQEASYFQSQALDREVVLPEVLGPLAYRYFPK